MVTRTTARLHFEDLDPLRFEELCLSIVYRMRRWATLDHLGRLGSDGGVDIRASEYLENGKKNVYHFQCKRYTNLTSSEAKKIILDYVKKNPDKADYYYLITGCNLSKKVINCLNEVCHNNGIRNVVVWSASILEAVLYDNYHDLLFAYFGVNMTENRNNRIDTIRRNITLKHQMLTDFLKTSDEFTSEEKKDLLNNPWKKFMKSKVLIRSVYDTKYPHKVLSNETEYHMGCFEAEVYDFYHNGLQVSTLPYKITAKVKLEENSSDGNTENVGEMCLQVIGCIPYENIIAYDIDGDEYYAFPHIFCDCPTGADPFDEICYISENRIQISKDRIIEIK